MDSCCKYFTLLSILLIVSCKDPVLLSNANKEVMNFEPRIIKDVEVLKEDTIEIVLLYYGMMCPCPQWATPENVQKYNASLESDNPIPIDSLFINIEPENQNTVNPFDLEYDSNPTFKFKGRFYEGKRKWTAEDGAQFNNRVFNYFECESL